MTIFIIVFHVLLLLTSPLAAQERQTSDTSLFRYVLDLPGRYINDHCLIRQGDYWHLFYTGGSVGIKWERDGNEVQIGHATSPDLIHWTVQPQVLRTGPRGSLDKAHVYAPYVVEREGTYSMFYVGAERTFFSGEHLLTATSTDLFNWAGDPTTAVFAPDTSWARYHNRGYEGGVGGPVSGRDPHIIHDSSVGYILYYSAELKGDPARGIDDGEFSCIAAATSPDLLHWTDHGPVLTRRSTGYDTNDYAHPESPCVVRHGGLYYLFWKGGNGTRYAISDTPFDFDNRGEYFLAASHASEIVQWDDRWFITSCSRALNDVTHAQTDRSRGLYIAELEWDGRHPRVRPIERIPDIPDGLPPVTPRLPSVAVGDTLWIDLSLGMIRDAPIVVSDTLGHERFRFPSPADPLAPLRVAVPTAGMTPGIYFVGRDRTPGGRRFEVR